MAASTREILKRAVRRPTWWLAALLIPATLPMALPEFTARHFEGPQRGGVVTAFVGFVPLVLIAWMFLALHEADALSGEFTGERRNGAPWCAAMAAWLALRIWLLMLPVALACGVLMWISFAHKAAIGGIGPSVALHFMEVLVALSIPFQTLFVAGLAVSLRHHVSATLREAWEQVEVGPSLILGGISLLFALVGFPLVTQLATAALLPGRGGALLTNVLLALDMLALVAMACAWPIVVARIASEVPASPSLEAKRSAARMRKAGGEEPSASLLEGFGIVERVRREERRRQLGRTLLGYANAYIVVAVVLEILVSMLPRK